MIREMIVQRATLLRELRRYFDQRGFYEVQPPCLARDCVVDAYLDPIRVTTSELKLSGTNLPEHFYLQTSPESAMKRMLADGAPSIYSIGPVFRSGEMGNQHNIEFTMLEWYQLDVSIEDAITFLGELACQILGRPEFQVLSYREAFQRYLGLDPIGASTSDIFSILSEVDESLADSLREDRDGMLDALLSAKVQPRLNGATPWIIRNYPLSQAALAKRSDSEDSCSHRFELFVDGVECANGYDELLDAAELKQRSEANNLKRIATGRAPLVVETTLLRAMQRGLPPCCGVALGLDRLLMLRTGADHLEQVIPYMIDQA